MSQRVWGSAVLAMLWVLSGFTILSFATMCGFWGALPLLVLFIVSLSAMWSERQRMPQVGLWRLWIGWLIASGWTLLMAIGLLYTLADPQPGFLRLVLLMFSPDAQGLELSIRDIHIAVSIVLLIWSGFELGVATYKTRKSRQTAPRG